MVVGYLQEEVECLPLARIAGLQEEKLRQSNVVLRASESALYRERWRSDGVDPDRIRRRADLKSLPYLTGAALKECFEAHPIDDIVPPGSARLWACTSGTTGSSKWIPYSDDDLSLFEQIALRDFRLCTSSGSRLKFLILTTAAPFVADGATYISVLGEMLHGLAHEHIPVVATEARTSLQLARARGVNVLFAFPSVAMKIAEGIADAAQHEAARSFREKKTLRSLIALLVTRVKKVRARDVFGCKYALFSGEALEPYREAIIEAFGVEPYELYTFTEFPCFNIECPAHDGIHLWIDGCIAEIIPQEELDMEERELGYVPRSVYLDEAEPGMKGEYVLTTFGRALPLVRYRTSDLIRVVSTVPCKCGRTHPRIKVLRRLDDIVNMGLVRFSTRDLEDRLGKTFRSGKLRNWQLRLERNGYRPKPVLLIEAEQRAGSELVDEVKTTMLEIEVLRVGCEAGIVAQPDVRLVPEIEEARTATGKVKRVVYCEGW